MFGAFTSFGKLGSLARAIAAAWSPADLTALAAWYDPSDLSTMFNDSAGTTPVATPGTVADSSNPVGLIQDKSGNDRHASQSTSTARPLLSARVNLLTHTEDFSHAPVTDGLTLSSAVTTGPFGDNDGWKFTETTSAVAHYTRSNFFCSFPAGQVIKRTGYFKQGSAGRNVQFGLTFGDDSFGGVIDLSTGTLVTGVTGVGTIVDSSVTLVNGWYECTVVGTMGASLAGAFPYDAMTYLTIYIGTVGPYYTGDGTSFVYAFGRDLRPASVAPSVYPYQSVPGNGSTYDGNPTKFPYYLKFDGVDDYLSTAAIDLTGTDKVTVFGGIYKGASAEQIVVELSTNTGTTQGAWFVTQPYNAASVGSSGLGPQHVSVNSVSAYSTSVFTLQAEISADFNSLRVNGVNGTDATGDQGTGNYGNWPLFIGARSGPSLPFNGNLYSLIIGGALYDAATILEAETWVAEKTGVTL